MEFLPTNLRVHEELWTRHRGELQQVRVESLYCSCSPWVKTIEPGQGMVYSDAFVLQSGGRTKSDALRAFLAWAENERDDLLMSIRVVERELDQYPED